MILQPGLIHFSVSEHSLCSWATTSILTCFRSTVPDGASDDGAVGHAGRRRHDDHLAHLHPKPALLTLGRFLHRLHRTRGSRVHDLVENQPGKLPTSSRVSISGILHNKIIRKSPLGKTWQCLTKSILDKIIESFFYFFFLKKAKGFSTQMKNKTPLDEGDRTKTN